MKKLTCKRGGKQVYIGEINRGVFRKVNVSGRVHMYHYIKAWGIDKEIFLAVIAEESHTIKILDTDTNILYKIDTQKFKKFATEREYGKHGAQLFCPLIYFYEYHKDGKVVIPHDEIPPPPEDPQLQLI